MTTQNSLELFLGGFSKVFDEQWQVDVKLKAGDSNDSELISAHKVVLAARSEVFKKMLESDKFKASGGIETLTLSELKHKELEAFVEFIYSDGSMLSEKGIQHVQSVFVAADKYEIPHLRDLCRKELISALSLSNAVSFMELSLVPFDRALYEFASLVVICNLSPICNTDEFKMFVRSYPDLTVEILKSYFSITTSK